MNGMFVRRIVFCAGGVVLTGAFALPCVGADVCVREWELGKRAETLRWFEDHQFGKTPIGRPSDQKIGARSVEFTESGLRISIICCLPKGASAEHPVPVFLFGDHMGGVVPPDYPQEEYAGIPTNSITARGYAYVRWNFNDLCPNASRYTGTLCRWPVGIIAQLANGDHNATNVVRAANGWGTIGAWAWGNSRVMDWIESRPELDATRVAVLGHSRGGKTALWTGAQDKRFAMTISNGSGCGGARLGRAKDPKAETIKQILYNFPNWFCPNFAAWIDRDEELPHDADDLIRLIAPRLVYVASGSEDAWAGPRAEKAAWDAAHDIYRAYDVEERMGYHCHEGPHKLRADDWAHFMDFADIHLKAPENAATGSPRANLMKVNCRDAAGWQIQCLVDRPEDGVELLTVRMTRSSEAPTPPFSVSAKMMQRDIHVRWHTDRWFPNVRPSWRECVKSDFLSNLPVHALSSASGRNRLTMATDDAFGRRDFQCGSDERGAIIANWDVPKGAGSGTCAVFRFRADVRDDFWSQAVASSVDWVRGFYLTPVVPAAASEPVFSTWYAMHTDVDAKRVESEARLAADLGMKSLFMDAGWYMDKADEFGPYAGDWQPSPVRFPRFAEHVARVKAAGLKYVLWFGLPLVGHKAATHQRFAGKYLCEHAGLKASILDPRFPECREYMIAALERAIRDWGVDGFKLDFIYSMSGAGPTLRPGDGRDMADTREALRRLLEDLHRRLLAIKPDVLIEFMHGHGNPAMQPYCNMLRVGDCAGDITENRSAIARMRLSAGQVAVHSDMLIWDCGETPENAARHVLATLFGTTQFSVPLSKTPAKQRKMIAHWIDFMRQHGGALRRGDFRPFHPDGNYPIIEGEDGAEIVTAVYMSDCVVPVATANKRQYLVNATEDTHLTIDCGKAVEARVFDTCGEVIGACSLTKGLQSVLVPVSGYLEIGAAGQSGNLKRK